MKRKVVLLGEPPNQFRYETIYTDRRVSHEVFMEAGPPPKIPAEMQLEFKRLARRAFSPEWLNRLEDAKDSAVWWLKRRWWRLTGAKCGCGKPRL